MDADRSFVGIPTIFDYHCPGQSNPTTLVWIHGQVNKHRAEVCVEKEKTRGRCKVSTDQSCIAEVVDMKKTIVRVAHTQLLGVKFGDEYPVKWSLLYGAFSSEILQTFFTG